MYGKVSSKSKGVKQMKKEIDISVTSWYIVKNSLGNARIVCNISIKQKGQNTMVKRIEL